MAAVAVGAAGSLAGETLPRVCRSHREGSGDNSHWPPPPGAARPPREGGGAGEGAELGRGRSRHTRPPSRHRGRHEARRAPSPLHVGAATQLLALVTGR